MKAGEFLSEDIRIAQLENGLTVILQEMEYSPVAAVTVAYRVGSLWETQKTRGLREKGNTGRRTPHEQRESGRRS